VERAARQTFTVDLRVDDNRFDKNTDLNNVSTTDKLFWQWDVGGVLSGQVGAIYDSGLISFVNRQKLRAATYTQYTSYVGAARLSSWVRTLAAIFWRRSRIWDHPQRGLHCNLTTYTQSR